jgi:hypothetical protein
MANWQVEFHIVPRRALAASPALGAKALVNKDSWAGSQFPSDYQQRLAVVAAAARSDDIGRATWGREEGDRVDVRSDEGRVTTVTVRVDVRRLDSRFGAALLEFVKRAGAVLVRSDGLVVEPTIAAYAASLRSSEAWKFASDPAAFLASNALNEDEDDD